MFVSLLTLQIDLEITQKFWWNFFLFSETIPSRTSGILRWYTLWFYVLMLTELFLYIPSFLVRLKLMRIWSQSFITWKVFNFIYKKKEFLFALFAWDIFHYLLSSFPLSVLSFFFPYGFWPFFNYFSIILSCSFYAFCFFPYILSSFFIFLLLFLSPFSGAFPYIFFLFYLFILHVFAFSTFLIFFIWIFFFVSFLVSFFVLFVSVFFFLSFYCFLSYNICFLFLFFFIT